MNRTALVWLALLVSLQEGAQSAARAAFDHQTATPAPATDRRPPTRSLERIAEVVTEEIRAGRLPGAVVLVGRGPQVLYHKAFGNRAVVPQVEPMTPDTIFDLASLTKVVATTSAVMLLVEEGRIRLSDRVAAYIPGFERYGKGGITIRHLLTHVSGLRPDLDLSAEFEGAQEAIARAVEEVPLAPPGERFIYSDINFFLLGDIVRRVSGTALDEFAAKRLFQPLGMRDTMFKPPASLRPRIAPTEACARLAWPCPGGPAEMLRGVVHDPTARRMGLVAGHAGLFSTAADLATFARMLLNGGSLDGVRIFSPLTVASMIAPSTPAHLRDVRGLGWDLDSSYSANRGDLLPLGSFGHTGFTGTSIWIDPATELFVIFLSNRVHPDGKGNVTALRGRVATLAAAALVDPVPRTPASPLGSLVAELARRTPRMAGGGAGGEAARVVPVRAEVSNGIDVLTAEGFGRVKGKRIGLLTNHTGRGRTGESTIDLLHGAPGVELRALFTPEHGIRGTLDAAVPSGTDERTGLPIYSLYREGGLRRPAPDWLSGLDAVVVDLQDIGARFYTYVTSMAYMMEEAAKLGVEMIVLDRPNPIGGFQIEGPLLDEGAIGFTGYLSMPVRHGMTIGELARLFNAERKIGAKLDVVPMRAWRRDLWFDQTGLDWINPSPNMRNMIAAALYPGIGAIEASNISVGRGTDTPFELVGAPWVDKLALAAALNARQIPGVSFYPVSFTPSSSRYANETCHGVFILVLDRDQLRPVRTGLEIAAALYRLHPAQYQPDPTARLLGSKEALERIKKGDDPAAVASSWASGEAAWRLRRARYLLY